MVKAIFNIILAVHGLIHLMGFLKAFGIAELKELTLVVTKSAGILWLLASLLFIAVLTQYLAGYMFWRVIAIPAILVSQTLIIMYW